MDETTYKIVRCYRNNADYRDVIKTGLTLAEAKEHCSDPETCSSTCESPEAKAVTEAKGPWFDAFYEE